MDLENADSLWESINTLRDLLAEGGTTYAVLTNQVDRDYCKKADPNKAHIAYLKKYGQLLAEGRFAELDAMENRATECIKALRPAKRRAEDIWEALLLKYGPLPYEPPAPEPELPRDEKGKLTAKKLPQGHIVCLTSRLHDMARDILCYVRTMGQRRKAMRFLISQHLSTGELPHFIEPEEPGEDKPECPHPPQTCEYLRVAYEWLEGENQLDKDKPTALWKHIRDKTGRRRDTIRKTFKNHGWYDPNLPHDEGTPTEHTVDEVLTEGAKYFG